MNIEHFSPYEIGQQILDAFEIGHMKDVAAMKVEIQAGDFPQVTITRNLIDGNQLSFTKEQFVVVCKEDVDTRKQPAEQTDWQAVAADQAMTIAMLKANLFQMQEAAKDLARQLEQKGGAA